MDISPVALLVPYMLGVLTFAVLGSFGLYRLFKFGAPTAGSWLMVLAFCLGTVAVVGTSLWQLKVLDWSAAGVQVSENPIDPNPYANPTLD